MDDWEHCYSGASAYRRCRQTSHEVWGCEWAPWAEWFASQARCAITPEPRP